MPVANDSNSNGNGQIRVVLTSSSEALDRDRVALHFARILYDRMRAERARSDEPRGVALGPEGLPASPKTRDS